ncbi:hypothetical protein EV177_009961, partial [Coemansia sp. RSA 1804]
MPRFWKCTNRRSSAVAALLASAGLVSVVGYVLYEIYKEAAAADAGDQDPPGQPPLLFTDDAIHQPPAHSSSLQHHRTIPAIATGRPYLAVSARGILLSDDMEQVHEDAVSIVERLALRYNVILVVVVDSEEGEEEQKTRVLELLGQHRIIPAATTTQQQQQQQQHGYPLGLGESDGGSSSNSVVWVEKSGNTAPSSPTSDGDDEIPPSDLPSSAVSSILKAP